MAGRQLQELLQQEGEQHQQQQQQLLLLQQWVTSLCNPGDSVWPLRFGLLPLPEIFRVAATIGDCPHLALRALLLDLSLHLPAVAAEQEQQQQQQQQQVFGVRGSIHVAAAALLSRLFLDASNAASRNPTLKSVVNSLLLLLLPLSFLLSIYAAASDDDDNNNNDCRRERNGACGM